MRDVFDASYEQKLFLFTIVLISLFVIFVMVFTDNNSNEIQYEYICVDNVMYIKHGSSLGVKYDPVTLQPETCFSEEPDFQR